MGTAGNQECFALTWADFNSSVVTSLQDIREQVLPCGY
jgi:hypothetical protein